MKASSNLTLIAAIILLAGTATAYGIHYRSNHPSTDDAYVNAHQVAVTPEVSGIIIRTYVHDHERVNQGTPLFDIDDSTYALNQSKLIAQVELTHQDLKSASDAVDVANSKIDETLAILALNKKNAARMRILANEGKISRAVADDAETQVKVAMSDLAQAQSAHQQSLQKLGKLGEGNAQVRIAKADLDLAKLNVARTHVKSPTKGIITQFDMREGDYVNAGQSLFTIIEDKKWWIDANFKETQLTRIKPGQPANLSLDMYPGIKLNGKVESINPASGASFSLMPSENASGNWVKVVQRFPVKITLDNTDPEHPLRLGASASVRIDLNN